MTKDSAYWTEWHLENWARWMNHRNLPDGLPKRAAGGLQNYMAYVVDDDKAYITHDIWAAERTGAVIDSLVPAQKCAIDHAYLRAVYRFPRDNYESLLALAKLGVRDGLRRRGVWLGE